MKTRTTYKQDPTARPLISFIITDYNIPPEMIVECLDSIFALSLSESEMEVILIDDGSDVSPINHILNYLDKILYVRQKNQGLSAARNTGLDLAVGEYIQFVDGDDKLLSVPYEHCLDLVRYHDSDMVLFHLSTKDKPSAASDADFTYKGPVSGNEYMRHNNLRASACGYIFKRALLGSLRFHRGILHEDEEFTPQLMLRAENIYETQSEAYYYRQHKGTITHKKGSRWTVKRLNDTVEVLSVLRDRADILPYDDRLALQRRIDQLTVDYLYNVIKLTHSSHYLERCVERLRKKGFFPVPVHDYTKKYKYFCRLVNTRIGRKILLGALR